MMNAYIVYICIERIKKDVLFDSSTPVSKYTHIYKHYYIMPLYFSSIKYMSFPNSSQNVLDI